MGNTLSEGTIATLDAVAGILIRCFIIAVGAMTFPSQVWLVLGDVVHSIHGQMFEISRREFDLFFLYTMTFMKGLNVLFFFFPYFAIKWYLRGKRHLKDSTR